MGADHLALVLPGGGYGPSGPALRFPVLALRQIGATVREVTYPGLPDSLDEGAADAFDAEVHRVIADVVSDGRWRRITVVAKSRGTMVLATLPSDVLTARDVRVVWVTPMFGLDYVRRGAVHARWRSLVVAGAADNFHDASAHEDVVRATGARSLVLDGADHLLEVAGDVLATLEGMRRVVTAVLEFASDNR